MEQLTIGVEEIWGKSYSLVLNPPTDQVVALYEKVTNSSIDVKQKVEKIDAYKNAWVIGITDQDGKELVAVTTIYKEGQTKKASLADLLIVDLGHKTVDINEVLLNGAISFLAEQGITKVQAMIDIFDVPSLYLLINQIGFKGLELIHESEALDNCGLVLSINPQMKEEVLVPGILGTPLQPFEYESIQTHFDEGYIVTGIANYEELGQCLVLTKGEGNG